VNLPTKILHAKVSLYMVCAMHLSKCVVKCSRSSSLRCGWYRGGGGDAGTDNQYGVTKGGRLQVDRQYRQVDHLH